jgi:kynurenine formamidase
MMQHVVTPNRSFGPGPYHRDLIAIDEHTGTQWDAPAHFVPPPGSGLPGAGPMGLVTGEKVPAWQFCGEACVIDVSAHVDDAPKGGSFRVTPEIVQAWEKKHRPLKFGDAVLFRSGYADRYYQPFPRGERFVQTALRKETPGWPAPTPETMQYLGEKGVMTLGIDSPSMGPLPDLAVATHQAGGKLGMIWTECLANLGALPPTGTFHAVLAAKHAGGSGGECRAIAITEPKLAARLIESARHKRVVDLSVTLDEALPVTWPGYGPGDEAPRYLAKTLNAFSKARGPYFARTHLFDSQVGTHVVPPSFSLPPAGFKLRNYSKEIRALLSQYEKQFGRFDSSDRTVEKVPLDALLGEAHVIDVSDLLGTTAEKDWPASPKITVDLIKKHERSVRPVRAGEVVLFRSGYSDKHFSPLPEQPQMDRLFAAPLAGQAEGWPAPTPEAVVYLAEKGVRCLGTDGPTLGGADRKQALLVYWAAASRGLFPVEYLTDLDQLPESGAFFLFAPIRIQGAHGGYGRALGFY